MVVSPLAIFYYYIRETDTLFFIYYLFSILYSFRKSRKEAKTSLRLFCFMCSFFIIVGAAFRRPHNNIVHSDGCPKG